ncbi:NAD-dependent DNA ligase LigA [bacterium]|nr:NAD-dependent DNA ligase LigA [bacterium]
MKKSDAEKRINKLKKEIAIHRYNYHALDKEVISEAALDSLKNELFKLEQKFSELITPDSPTQRVAGKPMDKFKKVKHSRPMLSLFDAFNGDDISDWENRIWKLLPVKEKLNYFAEIKLDGLAMALIFKKGKFIIGSTRGDGKIGEDVTSNLKTIESIPLVLRIPSEKELKNIRLNSGQANKLFELLKKGTIEVRGEAVMMKKVFKELNKNYKKEGKQPLANPRNGAAGSIRQLDPKIARERKLDFFVYAITTDLELEKHEQEHELARLLGFKIIKHNKYCPDLQAVNKFHGYWDKNKDKLPYECDGAVIKVNNLALWPKLGVVGKGPRYMMAYKFAAEQVTTKLREVIWQIGRTGTLTPVAVLDAVSVGGVVVSHATLHNMDEIKRLDIKIGDTVIIERAGDVIPKIVQVLPKLRAGKEKNIEIPKICPMCSSKVQKIFGEVAYKCPNKECYAVNLRRLSHWTSKGALDIEGLGPKVVEQLMKEGLVSDVADFYFLKEGDLKSLERFADKSAENLIKSIGAKKNVDLPRFLFGLGIRHVGEESAIQLADQFGSIENIQKATVHDFENLYDFGEIMAKSIEKWFLEEKNIELLKKLKNYGVWPKNTKRKAGNLIFSGQSFVITGTLDGLTRDEAKAKIRELGGSVSSTISKKTDYLLAGDKPGSKYNKAKNLDVKIIDLKEFNKLTLNN